MRKIAFWLSLVLLFIIPWEDTVSINTTGNPDDAASLTKFVGLGLAGLWFATMLLEGRFRKFHRFHAVVFFFFLVNIYSYLWSPNQYDTSYKVKTYAQILLLVLIFWELYQKPSEVRAGLQAYVLGGYVLIINTLVNYISGVSSVEYETRFAATGVNAVESAVLLLLGLPFAWYLFCTANKQKDRFFRAVNIIFLPLSIFATFLSGSRTSLFAIIPPLLFIFWPKKITISIVLRNETEACVDQSLVAEIRARYERVLESIESAARSAGRAADSVRLVTVTKTHPLETVRAAIEAGVRDLGENYAEEAAAKITAIGPMPGLRWHMIGHVQSRKADLVAAHFDMLHSLDSLKLAQRLNRFAGEAGRKLPVLFEVNVSGEESKFGYPAFDLPQWEALWAEVEQVLALPNLEIRGLMTMPPFADVPEQSRPFFRKMRALQEYLSRQFPPGSWDELSMGTSADFTVAVKEGATLVRVGTAILGARQYPGG